MRCVLKLEWIHWHRIRVFGQSCSRLAIGDFYYELVFFHYGRATDPLDTLLDEGLAMIDDGHRDGKRRYWFPCIFHLLFNGF
uniref:Uncharacterized protein n=1 Tax=Populus trichocarpa TaxID=3694 RepID=A0A2K1YJZ6_POPTR